MLDVRKARCLAVLLPMALGLVSMCTTQPSQGRFPVCKTEADCKGKSGGHCYDLRCVECRADEDCKAGNICNAAKQCERL
jgi:Cys-rich repeat protein